MHSPNVSSNGEQRLVVMGPDASVYDAARALEANHVGCVVVADGRRVLGIVTDRDLALRVVGYNSDPRELVLKDVMTHHVATVPRGASEADAARVMLERHVRRVPVEDDGRIVGIVTLDDLVIHGFDPAVIAGIVELQLAEPAALKEKGDVHPMSPTRELDALPSRAERTELRHDAHARGSYERLLRRVMADTGLATREAAEAGLDVLLGGVIQRLVPEESRHLVLQLPLELQQRLSSVVRGPNRAVTRERIERALAMRLGVSEPRATELATELGRAVAEAVSHGEVRAIKAQLPSDLEGLFV